LRSASRPSPFHDGCLGRVQRGAPPMMTTASQQRCHCSAGRLEHRRARYQFDELCRQRRVHARRTNGSSARSRARGATRAFVAEPRIGRRPPVRLASVSVTTPQCISDRCYRHRRWDWEPGGSASRRWGPELGRPRLCLRPGRWVTRIRWNQELNWRPQLSPRRDESWGLARRGDYDRSVRLGQSQCSHEQRRASK
jgi:hypothetical protein